MQTLPDGTKFSLPRRAHAANARKVISFRTTNGSEVYLWVMPRTGGGDCYLFNRGFGAATGSGFMTAIPSAFNGGLSGGADPVLFFAEAKPDVARSSCATRTARRERLTPVDGFVLAEITPAHYKLGTRLEAAVALDQSGKTIDTQRYEPRGVGVYPCKTPTNLGYGVKACP